MKNRNSTLTELLMLSCIIVILCALALPTIAQTNSQNILVSVLQNTVVDTNSTFWANEKIELRATTQTTFNKYESVLAGSYYFKPMPASGGGSFGVGAEIVNGAVNTVDAAYLTGEYSYTYFNLKLAGVTGVGYDVVTHRPAFEIGARLEVAISRNMFADTEALWQTDVASRLNSSGTFRVGVGFKF